MEGVYALWNLEENVSWSSWELVCFDHKHLLSLLLLISTSNPTAYSNLGTSCRSRRSMDAISSSEMVKSKTSAFCLTRSSFSLLTSGTQPFCRLYRISTWAGSLWYLSAMSTIMDSCNLLPLANGLKAWRTIPCLLQWSTTSRCCVQGCNYIAC